MPTKTQQEQKYIHVLPFNTIVFLIFFSRPKPMYGGIMELSLQVSITRATLQVVKKHHAFFFCPVIFRQKNQGFFQMLRSTFCCTAAKLDLFLLHTKNEPCLTWDFLTPSKMSVFAEK